MEKVTFLLPEPTGGDEKEELRQESRIRSQLAKGTSPERLGAQAAVRQQHVQNISAAELEKRHEQAVGHLNEVQEAIADWERKSTPYAAGRDTAPGGIPYAAGAFLGERSAEDKALQKELTKWQGIVDELGGQYYYRENEEKAAALTGDRAGQEKIRAVENILTDLRTLGEVATGQGGNQKDREALMKKYDLDQRELEVQATALMGQLQGELERAKAEAGEAGYNYDRMKKYQDRQEQVQRAIEGQKHTAEFAEKHPVRSSAASILISPVQGLDYFSQLAGGYGHSDTKKLESYVPANAYEMRATNFVRNVRGTVARELEEKHSLNIEGQNVASFLYQTGMSMGDFLFNAMLAGNFSGGLGGAGTEAAQKAASNLSLAIMGSGAAANTTAEAIERGLDNRKAFTLGAIAGVAEIVTEKVSLETLLDRTALDRSAMGYLLKNMAAEGSEEVASDLINWAADVLVAKDKSQWRQAIDEYKAQGMGEKEAFQMALKDQLISMAWSGAGGALSGGVMAGGSIAIDNAVDSYQNRGTLPEGEAAREQKTAPGTETADYTIQRDAVGNIYVQINADILKGKPRDKWGKTVQDTIKSIFGSGLKLSRGTVFTNRKGRGEYTNGTYTKMLERTDPEMYRDKLRMAVGSDGILENADMVYEDASHERADDIVGFNRGKVIVSVKDAGYTGDVLTAIYSDGKETFFDINNLSRRKSKQRHLSATPHKTVSHRPMPLLLIPLYPKQGMASRESMRKKARSMPKSQRLGKFRAMTRWYGRYGDCLERTDRQTVRGSLLWAG